ncbi:MAG: hypothetical protein GXC75_04280 [Xanthomonadaceae bacterium]|nr:hypothetical protein [Xanthomonadaceae bacterium]
MKGALKLGVLATCLACMTAASGAYAAGPRPQGMADEALRACRDQATVDLPQAPRAALARMEGLPRQLLALSSYLRSGHLLVERWSWDDARIREYDASPEKQTALAELAKVQASFANANPGYALHVNTEVRSLDIQLQHWNDNASVTAAAARLEAPAREACLASTEKFPEWLRQWRPVVPPNLAAPGLSPHGQGRAYDFQVMAANGALAAGTDSRRIAADWIAGGWATKVAQAVKESSPKFVGPLSSPNEPWHFNYVP